LIEHWKRIEAKIADAGAGRKVILINLMLSLRNGGPNLAEDIYLNLTWNIFANPSNISPGLVSDHKWNYDSAEIVPGSRSALSAVSKYDVKIAPDFRADIFTFACLLSSPFQRPFYLGLNYGSSHSLPVTRQISVSTGEKIPQ
jgi:hypothetical protein